MKETTIFLTGMRFYAYHGCFEEEQKIGTHFTVDVTLTYDAEAAVAGDDVEKSVNYQLVYKTIQQVMDEPRHLIETVADHIIRDITEMNVIASYIENNVGRWKEDCYNNPITANASANTDFQQYF